MSTLARILNRVRRRIGLLVDDALPMPAEQRAERDWTGEPSGAESTRRLRRFRLRMLEKRGKGGYR